MTTKKHLMIYEDMNMDEVLLEKAFNELPEKELKKLIYGKDYNGVLLNPECDEEAD